VTSNRDPLDEELTGTQVALELGLTRERVRQLAVAGRIPHFISTIHGRVYTRRGVEQFKAEREAS
jgi:hypothetical protein